MLASLDGKSDVFLGNREPIYFEGNAKPPTDIYLTAIDKNYSKNRKVFLFRKQAILKDNQIQTIPVIYPHVDFVRISNVSIETNSFDAVFYYK